MDNYLVSARKYRPSTFDSVVGQQALVTTLKNAITNGQLSHAYLFCGPRGVGKTTTARILAKTINCAHLTAEHEACNSCPSCQAFNEGRSFDIHELDAASNNSVENIRSLIDQVRIPPQTGKYSVYIIDEVHMLSQGAFNAFLKTLEEPPAYAIFILATTEIQKIPATILSRCQRYDFHLISTKDTMEHLAHIATKEGVEIDSDSLNAIATHAEGGMRDALSTFDQVVSYCGKKVDYQQVIDNLNILDTEYYYKTIDFCLKGMISDSLLLLNSILNRGFDAHNYVCSLAAHVRNLLVAKDSKSEVLLEMGETGRKRCIEQAAACSNQFLLDALEITNECDISYKQSKNKRLTVELMLIRMCQLSEQKKN